MSGRPVSSRPASAWASVRRACMPAGALEQLAGGGRHPGRAGSGHAPARRRVRPGQVRQAAETHLGALVRAIVYQQLAGAAAAAIHGRLIAALDGEVTAERLLALPDLMLRAVGLSRNKTASVRDLAAKVLDGTVVLDPRGLRAESDAEVVDRLSTVRGTGRWTAEMFLLFQLRRLDVWPTGDLGVRKGFGLAWQIPTPTAKKLEPLGDPFRPYRRRRPGTAGGLLAGRQCPHPLTRPGA